jgi:hypothetical protein
MHWSGQGEGRFPWHRVQNETRNTETGLIVQRSTGVTKQGRLQNIGTPTLTQPLLHHTSTWLKQFNGAAMMNIALLEKRSTAHAWRMLPASASFQYQCNPVAQFAWFGIQHRCCVNNCEFYSLFYSAGLPTILPLQRSECFPVWPAWGIFRPAGKHSNESQSLQELVLCSIKC